MMLMFLFKMGVKDSKKHISDLQYIKNLDD